jgi:hypothetical protein
VDCETSADAERFYIALECIRILLSGLLRPMLVAKERFPSVTTVRLSAVGMRKRSTEYARDLRPRHATASRLRSLAWFLQAFFRTSCLPDRCSRQLSVSHVRVQGDQEMLP